MADSHDLVADRWSDKKLWTTEAVGPDKQFDRWCEFVNEAHLHWSIERTPFDCFPAFIREGRYDRYRLASLTSAQPLIRGTRSEVEIAKDNEALYNIIYIARGSECLIIDNHDVELEAGTFVMWDSARTMKFITGKDLHQITLAIPHDRLHKVFPRAGDYVGKMVMAREGLSRVFVDHLVSLDEQFGNLPKEAAPEVLEATVSLLTSTLGATNEISDERCSKYLLQTIKAYIDKHLDNYNLSLARIATDNGISVRHLHRLFQDTDSSVSEHVLRGRLDRCKRDLGSPRNAHLTITEIAYRWGFSDSSTFSKAFRRQFGITPREYRAEARGGPKPAWVPLEPAPAVRH